MRAEFNLGHYSMTRLDPTHLLISTGSNLTHRPQPSKKIRRRTFTENNIVLRFIVLAYNRGLPVKIPLNHILWSYRMTSALSYSFFSLLGA